MAFERAFELTFVGEEEPEGEAVHAELQALHLGQAGDHQGRLESTCIYVYIIYTRFFTRYI